METQKVKDVDLFDVPHIKLELTGKEKLDEVYEDYQEMTPTTEITAVSKKFVMENRFEYCFIVYRNRLPSVFYYAQE